MYLIFPIVSTPWSGYGIGLYANTPPSPETYQFERLILSRYPEKQPPAIPYYFLPPGSVPIVSTDLRSNFYSSMEVFLSYESPLSKKDLDAYYQLILQDREWRILQSDFNGERSLFVAEGLSRRVITVVIRPKKDEGSLVRIFYKKSGNH